MWEKHSRSPHDRQRAQHGGRLVGQSPQGAPRAVADDAGDQGAQLRDTVGGRPVVGVGEGVQGGVQYGGAAVGGLGGRGGERLVAGGAADLLGEGGDRAGAQWTDGEMAGQPCGGGGVDQPVGAVWVQAGAADEQCEGDAGGQAAYQGLQPVQGGRVQPLCVLHRHERGCAAGGVQEFGQAWQAVRLVVPAQGPQGAFGHLAQ